MLIPALEVGGTHVTAAVVDLSAGQVLGPSRSRRPLRSDGPATDVIRTLLEVAVPVAAAAGRNPTLGVAIPGPFDYARGIGWFEGVAKFESLTGLDLGAALLAGLDGMVARIAFLNDADAFVFGEWAWGAAAGHRRVAGVTLGTGVGSGFLDGGRAVVDGPLVPPDGSVHKLSIDGLPLEEAVSSRALRHRARLAIEELPRTPTCSTSRYWPEPATGAPDECSMTHSRCWAPLSRRGSPCSRRRCWWSAGRWPAPGISSGRRSSVRSGDPSPPWLAWPSVAQPTRKTRP